MFVQSAKFIEVHSGKRGEILIEPDTTIVQLFSVSIIGRTNGFAEIEA